jgi:epoxyqueuosine reductase QueG
MRPACDTPAQTRQCGRCSRCLSRPSVPWIASGMRLSYRTATDFLKNELRSVIATIVLFLLRLAAA